MATVDGVLKHNTAIRDKMLAHNIGKYSQWTEELVPAIGEVYDIDYNRQLKDLKDGKNLVEFTHDGENNLSQDIERKYFSFGKKEKELYSVRDLTPGEYDPWIEFQQGSYLQYIDDVLGKDVVMRHVDYINNLLSGTYIENALRQTEVGVIKDVNVAVAMQGIITTNPNNMSGKDTIMGQISNRTYAQSLYNGAIFNSDRMRATLKDEFGDNYLKTYITPSLVNQYGNNLTNVFELSDILRLGAGQVRLNEDLGKDVHILDGREGRIANINSPEFIFLRKQLTRTKNDWDAAQKSIKSIIRSHIYTPEAKNGYINGTRSRDDWRYTDTDWKDVDKFEMTPGVNSSRYSGVITYNTYNEGENKVDEGSMGQGGQFEEFTEPDQFNGYTKTDQTRETLLGRTSRLFNARKLDTMIARFHNDSDKYGKPEFTDTARSEYGNSHGRNLLTLDAKIHKNTPMTNGYENPYCRTWTYHHQYNQVKKLIRPFMDEDGKQPISLRDIQAMNKKYRAYRNDGTDKQIVVGYEDLAKHTVLQDNGFVRITPKKGDTAHGIKDCMFSIENLAWKDVLKRKDMEDNLSVEQTGPNGGRIMWFPPYDLDFQESVNVNWSQNEFIGRGEKVYTYTNTERTGTLSFSILIDHPAIINSAVNSKGLGEEQDPEVDILRFFAGCNLLEENEEIVKDVNGGGEGRVTRTPKRHTIKFKIYFPNNFSGIITDKDVKNKFRNDSFTGYVESSGETLSGFNSAFNEDYWWQYILVGNNTCVPTNPALFRGYEIGKENKGLYDTDSGATFMNEAALCVCKDNQYDVGVNPGTKKDTCKLGENCDEKYTYHVDEDLHQLLPDKSSYNDTTSFQMNVTFQKLIDEKRMDSRKDGEYTFAELILALLGSEKVKGTGKYKQIESDYTTYLKECGVNMDKVSELIGIFDDKENKFVEFNFTGSADKNDPGNGGMLSKRRGRVCSELLKNMLGLDVPLIQVDGNGSVGEQGPAYDFDRKVNRYCEFTMVYEATEVSGMPSKNDKDEEPSGSTVTFESWLEAVKGYSPCINAYCNFLMGADSLEGGDTEDDDSGSTESYDDESLESLLRQHYDAIENKDEIDLTDETFLRSETDALLDECVNRDALILAYAVSSTEEGSNEPFREVYDPACDEGGYSCLCRYSPVNGAKDPLLGDDDDLYLRWLVCYMEGSGAMMEDYEPSGQSMIDKSGNPDMYAVDATGDIATGLITDGDAFNWYLHYADGVNSIPYFPNAGGNTNNMEVYYNDDFESEGYQVVEVRLKHSYLLELAEDSDKTIDEYLELYADNLTDFVYDTLQEYVKITYPMDRFDFIVPQSLIGKYKDSTETESYEIDITKVLKPTIMAHFIKDRYNDFGIESDHDIKQYLVRFCELVSEDTITTYWATYMVKNKNTIYDKPTGFKEYYDSMFTLLTVDSPSDEDDGPCVVSTLNDEIRQEAERERQKEAEAEQQRIEQERAALDENKRKEAEAAAAAKREYERYGSAYGAVENVPNMRYETEAQYFEKIEVSDPLLWKNLKSKFKYFNPAFHSISPEGFNARLTFLHQCTRQGQTYEVNRDKNGAGGYTGTASNLAFGRMPVCVIRIGDFIHTRAIINSMSISYAAADGMVWDLNPEGAGVQPMYAKISLSITLLGGQSLGAPIARLQNAISFNYYANAEAYDNRADVADYETTDSGELTGNVRYRRVWSPLKEGKIYDEDGKDTGETFLYNNYTDDFKAKHAENGSWHDLSDEEISEGLNGDSQGGGEGSESGATPSTMVYSPEMSEQLTNYPEFVTFRNENYSKVKVTINCSKGYKDAEYKSGYEGYEFAYNGFTKQGVTKSQSELETQMQTIVNNFVMDFVREHME